MSRSALGRGLGSLLAENGTRGVPMPGPGVGRLLKPEAVNAPERVSTPPSARRDESVGGSDHRVGGGGSVAGDWRFARGAGGGLKLGAGRGAREELGGC
jgi:hypothetical protein